ncbi:MAG: exodeoxyribonuclease VII large subunit, partial [Burkholderiales bacterium]|nr:exodeoxyribonuclease VII large subunit [Burkholderiales bacterium]
MLSRPDDFDAAAGPAPAERVLAVSEFARSVRGLVERGFPAVLVRGEISNFTRAPSGHLYFALKDASAQVRCVMWRGRAALLQWRPGDGDAVEVRAAASFYEARGEFQLTVESVRRAGAGALFEAFLRLKDKLAREGLFDAARKRPLPEFPRAIGVVTSTAAAALHDVLTTLGRRAPMVPVVIYPAPVQGDGAAARLAQAVATASARAEVDVLIVCRGGGSIEDLWSFNDEGLARAIAACRMPVVAGVGHETDFTIADFAADVRAATPTAAAEAASPARDVLAARLAAVARGLARSVRDGLARRRQRLDYAVRDLQAPAERLAAARRRLAGAAAALATTGAAGPAR